MKPLGGSEFGSDFYSPSAIEGVEKCNIRMLNSSRNWIPEQLAEAHPLHFDVDDEICCQFLRHSRTTILFATVMRGLRTWRRLPIVGTEARV